MQKELNVLLAGSAWGQNFSGVEKGPEAVWEQGELERKVTNLGWNIAQVERHQFERQAADKPSPVKGTINDSKEVGQALSTICASAGELNAHDNFLLTLGGDHSIALATIAAALIATKGELCVIWVDAHEDFNTPETSSSGKCHGMPLAALTHAFDIRKCKGFENFPEFPPLKSENLALIGTRDIDGGVHNKIHESKAKIYTMAEIDQYGIGPIIDHAIEAVNPGGNLPIHLSYDIDALDPAVAPATGTRVHGGLTYREGHLIAEHLAETGCLKSVDLVEVNPEMPGADITINVATKIIMSALGQRIMPKWLEM
ncbi:MAG: arginase [Alphaproteobacteria bacterium]|nr:arginase [Alphaproteobacteria bacterium]